MYLVSMMGDAPSDWEKFKDALVFLKDVLTYKQNFNSVRPGVGGALIALEGYALLCEGEMIQDNDE